MKQLNKITHLSLASHRLLRRKKKQSPLTNKAASFLCSSSGIAPFCLYELIRSLLKAIAMISSKPILTWVLIACCLLRPNLSTASLFNQTSPDASLLAGIDMPFHPLSFNSVTAAGDTSCDLNDPPDGKSPAPLKLHLSHRSTRDPAAAEKTKRESLFESTHRDLSRIQTLFKRITGGSKRSNLSADPDPKIAAPPQAAASTPELAGKLVATLESGVSLGSGEYFIDVFIGTPPRHLSLILDTGSDLNWVQCLPCRDCFEQHEPVYDPAASSSFRHVSCDDPRCRLVSSPDLSPPCPAGGGKPCPYFYWYGDRSNTTGDLAVESFTVNLTSSSAAAERQVKDVIFGCGHWNRGLFHGAAGLLGLGRGPLSFSSQLRALYGHTFSYCLVDRNSDLSVSSKLIFGEDRSLTNHPQLNYTSFIAGAENSTDATFYYVRIKSIEVGGETLDIPPETWELSKDGGGTIVDSGTTLSYFTVPAYRSIREAFIKKVKNYPLVEDFPILSPCYNVSGVERVELPEFRITFGDGAVWSFPAENYFIRLEPESIVCLAILGTPRSSLSILGNYQQQNFHILYDTKNSRLGFAPMRCADV